MIKVAVKVKADCEELLSNMPRGYEYELIEEDYADDGSGTVTFAVGNVDDLTTGMEQALDTHYGVIEYDIVA